MAKINSHFHVYERLETIPELRQVVAFAESIESIKPEFWNLAEPVNKRFDANTMDSLGNRRYWCFYWRRARPKTWGSVICCPSDHIKRYYSSITMGSKDIDCAHDIVHFAELCCEQFTADYGYVHGLTQPDAQLGLKSGAVSALDGAGKVLHFDVYPRLVQKYLPDLWWVNIFGKPYIELFGHERLLSAPAYDVRELEGGAIWMQLSPNISDIEADYDSFERTRQAVKQHLNHHAFFQTDLPKAHKYNVPDFGFGDDEKPVKKSLHDEIMALLTQWRSYAPIREPLRPSLAIEPEATLSSLEPDAPERVKVLARSLIAGNKDAAAYVLVYDGELALADKPTPAFIAEGGVRGKSEAELYAQQYQWTGRNRNTRKLVGQPMRVGTCPSLFTVIEH